MDLDKHCSLKAVLESADNLLASLELLHWHKRRG